MMDTRVLLVLQICETMWSQHSMLNTATPATAQRKVQAYLTSVPCQAVPPGKRGDLVAALHRTVDSVF